MKMRMSVVSWCARYRNGGDMINVNAVFEARSQALNEGCAYLLKILFADEPDFIIEEAFRDMGDALAVAERLVRYHTHISTVVVCHMHGQNLFGDGHKYYSGLTGIKTCYKPK